jgi:lysozyme
MPLTVKHAHYANGIDVSDNNGDFDWHAWDSHISFAFIKATQGPIPEYPGGLIDTQFERNMAGAKAIGLHRFAYHYFIPDRDPAAQARLFVETVRPHLDLADNLMFDFEESGESAGMSVHEVAFAAWVFLREVNRLEPQHHIVVYTYPAFAEMGYCAMLAHWGLYIAHWGVPSPQVPPPWKTWQFWQYAPGRNGTPDLDRFNGTEHELEIYCTR